MKLKRYVVLFVASRHAIHAQSAKSHDMLTRSFASEHNALAFIRELCRKPQWRVLELVEIHATAGQVISLRAF